MGEIMGKRYKNAPIKEAICEFRFQQSPWDLTIPGLVFAQLKADFPKRRRARDISVGIARDEKGVGQKIETIEKTLLYSEDESVLVQIGQNLLAINHLEPYSSWGTFRPLVEKSLSVYVEQAQPAGVQGVAVRYINEIPISVGEGNLEKNLDFYPHLGTKLPKVISDFIVGVRVPYDQGGDTLKVLLQRKQPPGEETLYLILDLEYSRSDTAPLDMNAGMEWVDIAHDRIESAFEACIKDELRGTFGEVTDGD